MDNVVNWPFDLNGHDVDLITMPYQKFYVILTPSDEPDADLFDAYMVKNGEYTFILAWTSLWDAEQYAIKTELGTGNYVITDVSPLDIVSRMRLICLDEHKLLVASHNGRLISTPLMMPTLKLYPHENMIWMHYEKKGTNELLTHNDIIIADTIPTALVDAIYDIHNITFDQLEAEYIMIGESLASLGKRHPVVCVRGHEFSVTEALSTTKAKRIENE